MNTELIKQSFIDELNKIALNRGMKMLFDKRISEAGRKRLSEVMLTPEKRQSLMAGVDRGNKAIASKLGISIESPSFKDNFKNFRESMARGDTQDAQTYMNAMYGRMGSYTPFNSKTIVIPKESIIDRVGIPGKMFPLLKSKNEPVLIRHELDEQRYGKRPSGLFLFKHHHASPKVIKEESLNARALDLSDRSKTKKIRSGEIETINRMAGKSHYSIVEPGAKRDALNWVFKKLDKVKDKKFQELLSSGKSYLNQGYKMDQDDIRSARGMKNWTYS